MGIFNRIFGRRTPEQRSFGGDTGTTITITGTSEAGAAVNQTTALGITAVLACVRVIADAISSLPCHIFNADGAKAPEHPLTDILTREANDAMGANVWREAMLVGMLLTGSGYSYIERGPDQRPIGLLPLNPVCTRPIRRNGVLVYQTLVDGRGVTISPADMFHVMFLTSDGINGLSPITTMRNALGLALAAEKFASRFYTNGGNLSSLLKLPPMSEAAIKTFTSQWKKQHLGPDNAHKVGVMPDGYDLKPLGHSPEAGQMIDVRKFQVHEIARAYRVPLAIIDQTANASFSSIESQERQMYEQAVRPIVTKFEAEAERKLLLERERGTRIKFNMDSRMRATTRERYAAHSQGISSGFLTVNEARAFENLPPVAGGDQLLRPLNLGPVHANKDDETDDDEKQPPTPATPAARQIITDAARRIATKLTKAYERAARKGNVTQWAGDFLARHETHVRDILAAPIAAAGLNIDAATFAAGHIQQIRHQIDQHGNTPDALLEQWDDLAEQITDQLLKG